MTTLPSLEDIEVEMLNRPSLDVLGETVSYAAAGDGYVNFKAFVDYGDIITDLQSGKMAAQDIQVQMHKTDVPVKPGRDARIILAKTSDTVFKPVNVTAEGNWWRFGVERV